MFKVTFSFDGDEIISQNITALSIPDALLKTKTSLEEIYGAGALDKLMGLSIYKLEKDGDVYARKH